MQNVSVTTSVTEVIAPGAITSGTIFIQNQSDTTMRLAFGYNVSSLTSSLGIVLEAGEAIPVSGPEAEAGCSAIHGGSGSKTLHWQRIARTR